MTFRFPDPTQRVTINGRTGSGKTVAGAWLLSESRFDLQPYVVLDFKDEKLFGSIERIKEIGVDEAIPTAPGLYHLRAINTTDDEIEAWLRKAWHQTNVGIFVDEGYLLPYNAKSLSYKRILVTGRSRRVPTFTLSQRPVDLPRHVFSEQDFFVSFHLNDKRDRETVEQFTPKEGIWGDETRLPKYHSKWYDIAEDFQTLLGPAPPLDRILSRFDERLKPRKRII